MDTPDNPGVKPPNPNDAKKPEGSFVKRNTWLFIVVPVIILFGLGGWYVFKKIKSATRSAFQHVKFEKADTSSQENHYTKDTVFSEPYKAGTRIAKLNITGGVTAFKLDSATDKLIIADTWAFYNRYQFDSHAEGRDYVINFSSTNVKKVKLFNGRSDSTNLKLNLNPLWEINVESGAAELNFDLSKFKVQSIRLNGGAGTYDIKIGQPVSITKIVAETGVSEVTIEIPKDAACRIEQNSGLSANEFDGFVKKRDREYEINGYDKAKNKILIRFNGGISEYKVHRY